MRLILLYIIIVNASGFLLMGEDKRRAKLHRWRIPEKTLFLCSLLGGSIGSWAGMYVFRHKTRKWYFVAGMPLIAALHAAFAVWAVSQGLYRPPFY